MREDLAKRLSASVIGTRRLVLRPLRESDAAAIFALFNDWDVVRWHSSPPWPYARDDAESYVRAVLDPADETAEIVFAITLNGKLIAVFRCGDAVHAIDDVCPHMGASLADGHVEGGIVTCPWHAWRFRLNDGTWADNPRIKIGSYQVRVQGDEVQVAVPEGKSS